MIPLLILFCVGAGLLRLRLSMFPRERMPVRARLRECRDSLLTPDSLAGSYGSVVLDMIGCSAGAAQLAACGRCYHEVVMDSLESMDSALRKSKQQRRTKPDRVLCHAAMSAKESEHTCSKAGEDEIKEGSAGSSVVVSDGHASAPKNHPIQIHQSLRSTGWSRPSLKVRFAEAIEVVEFAVEKLTVEQLDLPMGANDCSVVATSPELCTQHPADDVESDMTVILQGQVTVPTLGVRLQEESNAKESQLLGDRESCLVAVVGSDAVPAYMISAQPEVEESAASDVSTSRGRSEAQRNRTPVTPAHFKLNAFKQAVEHRAAATRQSPMSSADVRTRRAALRAQPGCAPANPTAELACETRSDLTAPEAL
eukprot:TRINITY_DN19244_c0_g1_i9.p1 TRINITY_DN19244_c0_g1~~TRINITY_DN19244_c0_g1_i9.p1  ORF type:complete len:368 (+),score=74.40 TRINITY_DN19244_c0_g1_i9:245-1348(+)